LKLVDFKDLLGRVRCRVQIGDQRKDSIRFFFCAHSEFVDTERDRVNRFPGDLPWTVFGRTALLLIRACRGSRRVNLIVDQRLASFVLEQAVDSLRELLASLEVVGVARCLNISQRLKRSVGLFRPSACLLLSLLRAADPMHPISRRGFVLTLRDRVAVDF